MRRSAPLLNRRLALSVFGRAGGRFSSGGLFFLTALLIWVMTVGWPIIAAVSEGIKASRDRGIEHLMPRSLDASMPTLRPLSAIAIETAGYAFIVAALAALLGWGPGRWLGQLIKRRNAETSKRRNDSARKSISNFGVSAFGVLAVLFLMPIVMPAYAVFYAWWQAWPADSALYAWAVHHNLIPQLRQATLILGLVCWSWPIAAWCVAASVASDKAADVRNELLALDAARFPARQIDRLRTDIGALAIAFFLIFLITFNNTTCFDLAGIFTFGNELRALTALGAPDRQILLLAWPAIAISVFGAAAAWFVLTRKSQTAGKPDNQKSEHVSGCPAVWLFGFSPIITIILWLGSVALPYALLARGFHGAGQIGTFIRHYGRSLTQTIELAALTGLLAGIVGACLAACWLDHRKSIRFVAHGLALGWLVLALVPASVVGAALEAAYNLSVVILHRPEFSHIALGIPANESDLTIANVIYQNPIILILGSLARFTLVAALLGRWAAAREPTALRDLRRVDAAGTMRGMLTTCGPALRATALATAAIVFVLAMGETAVTARVHPPTSDPLAVALLNAMHYQRPETVVIAIFLMLAASIVAAILCLVAWRPLRRFTTAGATARMIAFIALGVLIPGTLSGCMLDDPAEGAPLSPRVVFGSNGTAPGQFSYPRCIDADPERERLYVVDKTARVQRFSLDGEPEISWSMPARDNGKPTGVSVAPDGRVFIADTHYFRIIAFDPDGTEVMRFGEYGKEPGQFVYPTDIAFGPNGRIYVAEYGGNDRVQVFSPDGRALFAIGSFGTEPGEFNRPQSIAFNHERTELFVADACNHRIQVFDPEGNLLRTFGETGEEPGKLMYPYGLEVLPDGSLLVAEFGNNRIQEFAPTGEAKGVFGRMGAGAGELRYPWGVACIDKRVYVLDSGNHRVQVIRTP